MIQKIKNFIKAIFFYDLIKYLLENKEDDSCPGCNDDDLGV